MKPIFEAVNILITGGAGFIGSHTVRHFVRKYPHCHIYNLDKLTYAGNLANLADIEGAPNYTFVKGDITNWPFVAGMFRRQQFGAIVHLAAESHVDRSIEDPFAFVETNVGGTVHLLRAAAELQGQKPKFLHISTDEVYGSLGEDGYFTEITPYDPRSPYSASKAASDHLVRAWHHTYGLPVNISNCSNNYGPNQFPEKLIPLAIHNIAQQKPLPVYGKGENVRDWLYVEDHVAAIDLIFNQGQPGETYNIGGGTEMRNIDLVRLLCRLADGELGRPEGQSEKLITFVADRKGHDFRYAIDCSKIKRELGWRPRTDLQEGLLKTVRWYLENPQWLQQVTSGDYLNYYERHYAHRFKPSPSA